MGFLDSKKKTTNNNTTNDYTTTDNSVRQIGEGAIVAEGIDGPVSIDISSTDHGAVEGGLNVADSALRLVGDAQSGYLDFAASTISQALSVVRDDISDSRDTQLQQQEQAYQLAQTHSRSEGAEAMQSSIKAITIGGGLLASAAIVAAVVKRK